MTLNYEYFMLDRVNKEENDGVFVVDAAAVIVLN